MMPTYDKGITVVIPTIGPRKDGLLQRALASVAAQDLQPVETIVIEDTEHRGAWWARNEGLQRVRTKWTAFLDDDDELLPTHLRACMMHQETKEADVVYPWFELWIMGEYRPTAQMLWIHKTEDPATHINPEGADFDRQAEYRMNYIPVTALVSTRKAVEAGGFKDPNTPGWPHETSEEWALWLRMLERGAKFVHLPQRTWRYHHHGYGTVDTPGNTSGNPTRW